MTIEESVREITTKYSNEVVSDLAIGLSIEMFKDIRRYPSGYDDERIERDMKSNCNKIAMAAVEIEAKNGVENQTSHSENGVSRVYHDGIMAYKDVLPLSHIG